VCLPVVVEIRTASVARLYQVEVPRADVPGRGQTASAGVELEDEPVRLDAFWLVDSVPGRVLVKVVLHDGHKHVVGRLMEEVGYPGVASGTNGDRTGAPRRPQAGAGPVA
jgi:16S rRNA U516 pseudouridylate synthase RsuA-like enzyme